MHLSSTSRRIALLAATAALIVPLISVSTAFADDDDTSNIGVARISLITGSVAVERGDATTPTAAAINAPVLAGDYLTTGDDTRAEVEISGGTAVRLGSDVQLRFTHLDNDARALQLAAGTIELRLLRGTDGSSDIDTPSISIRPRSSGSYRITVTPDGQTLVTVRSGDAEIVAPQGDESLATGSTLVASGPASSPTIVSQDAVALDEFDGFNQERDSLFEQAQAQNGSAVDANITGVSDLDQYGRWVSDPTYGQVWTPTVVAADWAPYRTGRWVWEDGFGWTWVAAEPWGWAPYHYGSWFHSPVYGWAWYPPRPAAFVPVWRPALVAFFSFGGGGGSSFGVGYAAGGFGVSVGWVPLAPFEPYHPWWHPGWGGGTNVTIVNNTYITNTTIVHSYRNAEFGVTSVSQARFTAGDFRHTTVVATAQLQNVQAVRGAVPVVPSAANLRYSNAHIAPELAARPAFDAHGFAGAPAPQTRVPFEQQRAAVSSVTRIPISSAPSFERGAPAAGFERGAPAGGFDRATTGAVRTPSDAGTFHGEAPAPAARPAGDAWNRYGDTRGVTTAPRSNAAAAAPYHTGYGYAAPARTGYGYTAPARTGYGYAAPARTGYTAPARGYAAPARTYAAPSRPRATARATRPTASDDRHHPSSE